MQAGRESARSSRPGQARPGGSGNPNPEKNSRLGLPGTEVLDSLRTGDVIVVADTPRVIDRCQWTAVSGALRKSLDSMRTGIEESSGWVADGITSVTENLEEFLVS